MNKKKDITYIDFDKWNDKIIKVGIITYVITIFIELLLFRLYKPTVWCSRRQYFNGIILTPTIFQGIALIYIIFIAKVLSKFVNQYITTMLLIIGEVGYTLVAVAVHTSVEFMCIVLMYPILFTSAYKDKFFCWYTCTISILGYILLKFGVIPSVEYRIYNSSVVYCIIFTTLLVFIAIWSLVMKKINVEFDTNAEKLREEASIMKTAAEKDSLTNLYNHNSFYERLNDRIDKIKPQEKLHLIVVDIDNFKNINDTFGHLYGDAVIAMVAGSIKSTLDSKDIIGRFGGDEFLVYIDNTKPEKLERKLENIRLAILKMRIDKNDEKDISCSMGVTLGRGRVKYEDLFRQADSALYMAKTNGKNRFEYFNGEFIDKNALTYTGIMTEEDESEEVSENHDIIMVALEIASKSTDSDNAISNLMRHIGVAVNLDCIQIMKYDMINDKVEIEFQWWKEHDGDYNVVFTDKKSGYYEHNDLVLFKKKFQKDNIFKYTPDFKEGFTKKYRNIF